MIGGILYDKSVLVHIMACRLFIVNGDVPLQQNASSGQYKL